MGADLYIDPLFTDNFNLYKEKLNNKLDPKEYRELVDKAYSVGYFRESYGGGGVLSCSDLSWWKDIVPLCNNKGELTPTKSKQFIKLLKDSENTFNLSCENLEKSHKDYIVAKRQKLINFLELAIEKKLNILASL